MRRAARVAAVLLALPATLLGAYALAVLAGAVWTTAPAPGPKTRTITVFATPVHAEIIVPIADDVADWRWLASTGAFAGEDADWDLLADVATHASFGWGAESFYRNVRLLSDIRFAHVLDGLWDDTLVHVTLTGDPADVPGAIRLQLTDAGYRTLIAELEAAFARTDGAVLPLPGEGYFRNDGFFLGTGVYTPLATCNEWVAARLRAAGVAVGRFTPFAQTLEFSLRRSPQGPEQRAD